MNTMTVDFNDYFVPRIENTEYVTGTAVLPEAIATENKGD